jgi:hypothetical protein
MPAIVSPSPMAALVPPGKAFGSKPWLSAPRKIGSRISAATMQATNSSTVRPTARQRRVRTRPSASRGCPVRATTRYVATASTT